MDILKNQIDADSILTSLYTKSAYTELFRSLLRSPTPVLLSKLVINYHQKMLHDLKFLIKNKFNKLNLEIQKNINSIALLLLGYGINVDSIIINLLRVGYSNFPVDHKYFKEFKGALPFIKFHHTRDITNDYNNLVTTLITYDMEKDIFFIASALKNVKFYVTAFTSKYRFKIEDIILFIQARNLRGRNIEYMLYNLNVVGKMSKAKGDVSWMIKDMEKEETVVTNINGTIENNFNKKVLSYDDNKSISNDNNILISNNDNLPVYNKKNKDIVTRFTPESFLHFVGDLSFPKYYSLIQDMKKKKTPILESDLYKGVVFASFEYDNYVQVYLWKILIYQKILFEIEIEIEESDLKTEESLEGYEIYLNIH